MMKKVIAAGLWLVLLILLIPTLHSLPGVMEGQSTPPLPIPSNLGTWGKATVVSTATADLITAPSASTTRYYVDQVQCFNQSSTGTVGEIFLDGDAATTVKQYFDCPPSFAVGSVTPFSPPVQLNAGAAATIEILTAAGQTYINLHAFSGR